MNCDTCSEKFTSRKDLIQHVSNIKHTYQCSHFFCLPCSLPIYTLSSVSEHIESEEHSIMALATGINFDCRDEGDDNVGDLFPPLFSCLLCSVRGGNSYEQHVRNPAHGKIASLLRSIIGSKEIRCLDEQIDKKAHEFLSKVINVIQKELVSDGQESEISSDSFDCHLCNVYFNKHEHYKLHLEDQSHKRMKQFMIKIITMVKEMDIIDLSFVVKETFNNSLTPLYYCELCCLWIETTTKYVRHAKSITHTRIQELDSKVTNKRNGDVITLRGAGSSRDGQFYRSKEYCKLCTVWGATGYRRHLKDAGHVRIENFLNSLPTEDDKMFLEFYMDAQAQVKVGESPPSNYCVLCNILYSESEEYQQHLKSAEHEHVEKHIPRGDHAVGEKARKMLKTSSSSSLRQRCYSSRDKSQNAYEASEYNAESFSCGEGGTESRSGYSVTHSVPQEHYCELCDFLCYNVLHYDKHLMGDQHKRMRKLLNKKVKKTCVDAQASKTWTKTHPLQHKCELCEVFNTSREKYDMHLNSGMHRKNQWLLYVLKQRPL